MAGKEFAFADTAVGGAHQIFFGRRKCAGAGAQLAGEKIVERSIGVSAVRALGAEVTDAAPLVRATQQMGMPLYQCQPPTGYKDTADAWVNTGALVSRMNFAIALTGRRLKGVVVDAAEPTAMTLGGPDFQRR